jgi:hypothetical protein
MLIYILDMSNISIFYAVIMFSTVLISKNVDFDQFKKNAIYKNKQLPLEKMVQLLIKDLNAKLSSNEIKRNFHLVGNAALQKANIIFVPEQHNDAFSKINQVRIVDALSEPGDIVLRETAHGFDSTCEDALIESIPPGNIKNSLEFDQALFSDSTFLSMYESGTLWPHSKTMICNGWDSSYLTQQLFKHLEYAYSTLSREYLAWSEKDENWILERRKKTVSAFNTTIFDLALERPFSDNRVLVNVVTMASSTARNRKMAESIKKYRANYPSARIFVLAGNAHVPFVDTHNPSNDELSKKELEMFIEGQKYLVIAHKEIFKIREGTKRSDL